ncbi:collagen alpha-2(I) chain-like [Leopardus geoffroyi]|uniref:collagen alpha-2(I) chain-like n=1 Tax=Leopardus geoffroyi TaxID=46844 RepID=UPI001E261CED|nr:collagen alpha-2(I) chain-like [Leopardus geoffroyi]
MPSEERAGRSESSDTESGTRGPGAHWQSGSWRGLPTCAGAQETQRHRPARIAPRARARSSVPPGSTPSKWPRNCGSESRNPAAARAWPALRPATSGRRGAGGLHTPRAPAEPPRALTRARAPRRHRGDAGHGSGGRRGRARAALGSLPAPRPGMRGAREERAGPLRRARRSVRRPLPRPRPDGRCAPAAPPFFVRFPGWSWRRREGAPGPAGGGRRAAPPSGAPAAASEREGRKKALGAGPGLTACPPAAARSAPCAATGADAPSGPARAPLRCSRRPRARRVPAPGRPGAAVRQGGRGLRLAESAGVRAARRDARAGQCGHVAATADGPTRGACRCRGASSGRTGGGSRVFSPCVSPGGARAPGPRCAMRKRRGQVVPAPATSWVRRIDCDSRCERARDQWAVPQTPLLLSTGRCSFVAHLELSWRRGADYFLGEMRLRRRSEWLFPQDVCVSFPESGVCVRQREGERWGRGGGKSSGEPPPSTLVNSCLFQPGLWAPVPLICG